MRKYVLNPETLLYEIKEASLKSKFFKGFLLLAGSLALAFLYFWIYTSVLGLDSPKTALLKAEATRWDARLDVMDTRLDHDEEVLSTLEARNNDIYRSVFGMDAMPSGVRPDGEGLSSMDGLEPDDRLRGVLLRLDALSRRTYICTTSFDEVGAVASKAGDMASCIPSIPPIIPDPANYTLSSLFGSRTDPFTGESRMHTGVDLAMKTGNPVYATGDGVVEAVDMEFFGYGTCITIDHGFGFETRYAHLNSVNVREGMKVKRGDLIARTGQSGRASGPHLHYEVIYKGEKVNPLNYFDLSIPKEDYLALVAGGSEESGDEFNKHGFSVYRRPGNE